MILTTSAPTAPFSVARSPLHGRGVFSDGAHPAGTELWTDPILLVANDELGGVLGSYVIEWDDDDSALALGNASLLNHSATPNAQLVLDEEELTVTVVAVEPVAAGDEVLIDYGIDHWTTRGEVPKR